jgi:putative FmdB family regulatory protein
MPIFEYKCQQCDKDFEKLVYGSNPEIFCPQCGSNDVNKKFSTFGMSGVDKQTSSGCTTCTSSSCRTCH